MRTSVQVSMFQNGFPADLAAVLRERIPQNARFAFVASEFEVMHEKTDKYFERFLNMFTVCGIEFSDARVVDGRMTPEAAQKTVKDADVIWLSGGDTPVQFAYLEKYSLSDVLKVHDGVFIGMSAGAINMAETAVCTLDCGHDTEREYPALGVSPYTVEPHFDAEHISDEILHFSERYEMFGIGDEGAILYDSLETRFFGKVFRLCGGRCEQLSGF